MFSDIFKLILFPAHILNFASITRGNGAVPLVRKTANSMVRIPGPTPPPTKLQALFADSASPTSQAVTEGEGGPQPLWFLFAAPAPSLAGP